MRKALLLIAMLFAGVGLPAERMEQPVAALVKQLQAGTLAERRHAAAALGNLGPKAAAATPALIEALKDWRTRKAAAEALMRVGPAAAEAVFKLAGNDRTRETILAIFAGMKPRPMAFLLQKLKGRDASACSDVMEILQSYGDDAVQAIPVLQDIVRRPIVARMQWESNDFLPEMHVEHDPYAMRKEAARTLCKIGPRGIMALVETLDGCHSRPSMPYFRSRIEFEDLQPRASFARPEQTISEWWQRQNKALKELALANRRSQIHNALVQLAWLHEIDASIATRLLPLVKHEDSSIAVQAIQALENCWPVTRETIAALVSALEDDRKSDQWQSAAVQLEAAKSLFALGQDSVVRDKLLPMVRRQLHNKREFAVAKFVESIGARGLPVVPELLRLVDDADTAISQSASLAIAATGPNAIRHLLPLLDSANLNDRNKGLGILAMFKRHAKAAIEPIALALRDKEPTVRRTALTALTAIGSAARPVAPEVQRLFQSTDEHEWMATMIAMSAIDPSTPFPAEGVTKCLASGHVELLEALIKWGPRAREVAPLIAALLKNESRIIQCRACAALAAIDESSTVAKYWLDQSSREHLGYSFVLAGPWSASAVRMLLHGLENGITDHWVRWIVLENLQKLGDDAADIIPVARSWFHNEKLAFDAARAAGILGPRGAELIPELIEFTYHCGIHDRSYALEALGKISPVRPEVVATLIKALDFPDESDPPNAAHALGVIGPKASAAVGRLRSMVETGRPLDRLHAAQALVRITGQAEPGVAFLASFRGGGMSANGIPYRATAIRLLAELGPLAKPAIPSLRVVLKSRRPSERLLRAGAAAALAAIGPAAKDAEPELIALLHDRDDALRREAALALGEVGGPRSMPALAVAFEDEREDDIARVIDLARGKVHARNRGR